MLIDDLKRLCPNLKLLGTNAKIKDAIIFFINDDLIDFARETMKKLKPYPSRSVRYSIPSHLPYKNIFLQFNGRNGVWFCEEKMNNGETKLTGWTILCFFSNKDLNNLGRFEKESIYCCQFFYDKNMSNIDGVFHYDNSCKAPSKEGRMECMVYTYFPMKRFLNFLTCTNIALPQKRGVKRTALRRKRPLNTHYTLELRPTSSNKDYESKNPWSNRVHLCRGHIKTYTAEKPLFGKIVGNIWCPPHARGNKKEGIIHKDYAIGGQA